MKKITYFVAAALLAMSYSCSEDFLGAQPTGQLTDAQLEDVSQTRPEIIAGTLSGVYVQTLTTGTGGTTGHDDFGQKGYDIMSDFLSGDLALSVSTYGWYRGLTELQNTTDFTVGDNRQVWRYYYRIIKSSNTVIAALGGGDAVPDLDTNKHILGQAKTLRAYAYFYLTQFYSDKYEPAKAILPIYTEPTQLNQPKSTTTEVFNLIVKDLEDSISLLETFTRSAKNEINKSIAQGLLAYTYGYMGEAENLAKAKTLTSDIINNGGFQLMSSTEVRGGFNNINTPGWMWGFDITTDLGLDLISWWGQMDVFTYSYQWAGDKKAIDAGLFAQIPSNDIRKGQFLNSPSSSNHLIPYNKFYDPARSIGGQRNITTDYVYMRVAEMYLLNAEMSAKTGDEATAKTSLKALVSQRVPDASYIDALSGKQLLDEIYLQTRIELFAEGKSYLALKRNRATVVRGTNHLSNVGTPISYDDNRLTFEIPQDEIQNNPFISEQN